jgi:hypothetical protein
LGRVYPGAELRLDASRLVSSMLSLRGVHNYRPEHLALGLERLVALRETYPFASLVGPRFGLEQVNEAFAAAQDPANVRVAVAPG